MNDKIEILGIFFELKQIKLKWIGGVLSFKKPPKTTPKNQQKKKEKKKKGVCSG